jgi:hypothetical protein
MPELRTVSHPRARGGSGVSDWRTFYKVARSFTWGSGTYSKGEIVRADDPIVEQVNRQRPDLLRVT